MQTTLDRPFTPRDLRTLGMSRRGLRGAVQAGRVRPLLRGVYVAAEVPDSAELRIEALSRVVATGHIACDRTAAWLHGVDVYESALSDQMPPVELCTLRGSWPTERPEIRSRTRDLAPVDVERLGGVLVTTPLRTALDLGSVLVTTPLRTALDLGCILRRRDALAALDQFRRQHGISEQALRLGAVRFFRRRGVVQLRQLIPLSDPRAESPRESWTRLAIIERGLPAPTLQHEIFEDGLLLYRLDLAYPASRIAVEYDGEDFHDAPEQIEHDLARRAWLRAHGWRVLVVRKGDFTGDRLDDWLAELREALRTPYTNLRW